MGEKSEARKVRRDKGIRLLTERDVWVLSWIAEQSCVRFDQLQRLLSRQPQHRNRNAPGPNGLTSSAVDQVVSRWMEEPAFVEYKRSYVGQPGWIWLTTHAEQTFDLCFEDTSHQGRERDFARRYMVNQVRLYCEEQYPEASWKSKRSLHVRPQQTLMPSGELWLADRSIAIEIAQFGQSSKEIAEVLTLLERVGRYQAIWYFSSDAQRSVVEHAQQSLPAECRTYVRLMSLEPLL